MPPIRPQHPSAFYALLSRGSSAVTIAMGFLILAGWLFNSESLIRFFPGTCRAYL